MDLYISKQGCAELQATTPAEYSALVMVHIRAFLAKLL